MPRGWFRPRALLLTLVLAVGGAPAIATAAPPTPTSTGLTLRSTAQVETVRGAAPDARRFA